MSEQPRSLRSEIFSFYTKSKNCPFTYDEVLAGLDLIKWYAEAKKKAKEKEENPPQTRGRRKNKSTTPQVDSPAPPPTTT